MSEFSVWMSPLTHRIYVGRVKGTTVLQKQDITAQAINGAIAHLNAMGETEIIVSLDEGRYRVKISKEDSHD